MNACKPEAMNDCLQVLNEKTAAIIGTDRTHIHRLWNAPLWNARLRYVSRYKNDFRCDMFWEMCVMIGFMEHDHE